MLADEGSVDEWGAPRRIRALPVSDLMAGLSATIGVASALYHRALTGEGQLNRRLAAARGDGGHRPCGNFRSPSATP